jgi:hypothetical protein
MVRDILTLAAVAAAFVLSAVVGCFNTGGARAVAEEVVPPLRRAFGL